MGHSYLISYHQKIIEAMENHHHELTVVSFAMECLEDLVSYQFSGSI